MKITLSEYKMLPEQEQDCIVFNEGIFIDHFAGNPKLSLFAVEKFFVEVEYSSNENRIIGKRIFKTGKELLKYSPIKIESL